MGNDGSTAMESKLFILEIRNFIEKFEILFVCRKFIQFEICR